MNRTYLHLGSNLGDRGKNLEEAVILLKYRAGKIGAKSAVYETEPWEFDSVLNFYNQALEIFTLQDPLQLLHTIHEIEKECGRVPAAERYAPRPLDIDILFFNDFIINRPELILPHPRLHLRRFVLVPLAEIAPQLIHPLQKRKVWELLQSCQDDKKVIQRLP